jgi:hypothetical protein
LACNLKVRQSGDFSSQLHIFVDDGGLREIIVTVHGTAAAMVQESE